MAWLNREKLPPELQNLKPEEIAERLKAAEEKAARVDTLEAQVKTGSETIDSLNKKVGQFDQVNNELTELRKKAEARQEPVIKTEETGGLAGWLLDPDKAFEAAFNQKAGPLAQATLMSGILSSKMAFVDMITKVGGVELRLWRKYEKEVSDLVEKLPPEQRIWPQSWVNQFTFVKGIHASEIAKEAQSSGDAYFSEGVTTNGSGVTQEDRPTKLSEMEVHAAKLMKKTPEEYQKMKTKIQGQGRGFWTA